MVQRDQIPEEVNDIDRYLQDKFTYQAALDDASDIDVSIDDGGNSITIDTNGTELDLVVKDIVDALEQANNISTNIDNQPISIDDNESTITIDTDGTELDIVVQDIVDALNSAEYVDNSISTSSLPSHIRNHSWELQPDGDLVPEKADGQAFELNSGLDANEIVTSEWIDTDGWRTIELIVESTVQSVVDGVEVQFSNNIDQENPTVNASITRTFANEAVAQGYKSFEFGTKLDGFRVRYTNGDQPTTSDFAIIATLREVATPDSADYVDLDSVGDGFVTVGTDPALNGVGIAEPASLFGDLQTIERRTVIDATSTFGTSTLRDEVITTGSASVEQNPAPSGEIQIGTGTTPNSSISIQTAEYGRYTPGFSAQSGIGIRLPAKPSEGEARWGYFDDGNGFYWGFNGEQNELFISRKKNNTEVERVYRSDFNRQDIEDRLNRNWEPTEGDIFQIDFSWYGYGIILFSIVTQTVDDNLTGTPRQISVPVHAISVKNENSISDPNQPIRVELENGDAGEDIDLYLGGRQFSVFGEPPAEKRITAATRVDTTIGNGVWTYIQSWRRDVNEDANSKINIRDLSGYADGDLRIALLVNPNISGTTYEYPDLVNSDETLLQVSKAGSFDGIGSGTKVWEDVLNSSGTGNTATGNLAGEVDVRLGQANELVLVAQGIGNSPEFTGTVRMIEDW